MCIIVAIPANKVVSEETLHNCWVANDHGAGFMYPNQNDEELVVKKGLMTWEDFIQAYRQVPSDINRVIHFRIKTHGNSDEKNTHPFLISDRLGFVHNGVISGVTHTNKDMNDTWHFSEQFLKPMHKADGKFLNKEWNMKLLGNYIGGSKLVFMNHKGQMWFVNESKGITEEDGVWYSNTSYKSKVKVTTAPWTTQQQQTPRTHLTQTTAPHWMCEGAYVRIKVDMPQKRLKKGELVYIDNLLGNSLQVVIHDIYASNVIERKLWLNIKDVEEPDYGYVPESANGWYL
jgi:predicted glutamine amidotransferase